MWEDTKQESKHQYITDTDKQRFTDIYRPLDNFIFHNVERMKKEIPINQYPTHLPISNKTTYYTEYNICSDSNV